MKHRESVERGRRRDERSARLIGILRAQANRVDEGYEDDEDYQEVEDEAQDSR